MSGEFLNILTAVMGRLATLYQVISTKPIQWSLYGPEAVIQHKQKRLPKKPLLINFLSLCFLASGYTDQT